MGGSSFKHDLIRAWSAHTQEHPQLQCAHTFTHNSLDDGGGGLTRLWPGRWQTEQTERIPDAVNRSPQSLEHTKPKVVAERSTDNTGMQR
jgi:hypothetical protein